MSEFRTAYVYVRNQLAGELSDTDDGYTFSYDPSYLDRADAAPVSLTLPLRGEVYTSRTLFSFFDGLIPEGWLLHVTSRNWKLDIEDRFGIMLVACKDSIGCVSVQGEKL